MTDLDALARRIARIYAEDDEELACESEIKDALEVAHTAGRAEGFAEGAREMQEACAVLSETVYANPHWEPLCRSAGRSIADELRAMPLPTIGEKS